MNRPEGRRQKTADLHNMATHGNSGQQDRVSWTGDSGRTEGYRREGGEEYTRESWKPRCGWVFVMTGNSSIWSANRGATEDRESLEIPAGTITLQTTTRRPVQSGSRGGRHRRGDLAKLP